MSDHISPASMCSINMCDKLDLRTPGDLEARRDSLRRLTEIDSGPSFRRNEGMSK